jgi:hypothetical protein
MSTTLTTRSLRKLFASNVALPAAFSALAPQTAIPSAEGVVSTQQGLTWPDPVTLRLTFFGTAAADLVFKARLSWWFQATTASGAAVEYFPVRAIDLAVTLGTRTASSGLGASNYYADTIAVAGTPVTDAAGGPIRIYSPADNGIAMVTLSLMGAKFVQVQLGDGSATAATGNVLAGGI